MEEMRRLRDINSALPGLMLGIIVCGVISEIAGVFLVADKLNYTIGLWIGVLTALGMALHMAYVLDRVLDRGEKGAQAAVASRKYLVQACSPITGMSAEYAEFDGSPMSRKLGWSNDRHDWFYSDSYRTVANIGLDYEWFGIDEGQCAAVDRLQEFLLEDARRNQFHTYEINGTVAQSDVLHPVAIIATVAQGSLAANNPFTNEWIERFWNTPMRTGVRRYYDNCLYFFAFLALSGKYRIW